MPSMFNHKISRMPDPMPIHWRVDLTILDRLADLKNKIAIPKPKQPDVGSGIMNFETLFKMSFGWNFFDKPCGSYALVKLQLTFSIVQIWKLLHLETFWDHWSYGFLHG